MLNEEEMIDSIGWNSFLMFCYSSNSKRSFKNRNIIIIVIDEK